MPIRRGTGFGKPVRVLKVIDNQVRSLRKRQVIDSFKDKRRNGMYVGIRSDTADYPLPDPLPADPALTMELAATPTRSTRWMKPCRSGWSTGAT